MNRLTPRGGASDPDTRRLAWTVLGLWTVTEATGLHMLWKFASSGGFQDENLDTTYPGALVANATLGSAAIAQWGMFLATRRRSLAWAAFGQFTAAIAAGTALGLPWHQAKRTGRPSRRAGGPEALRYHLPVEVGHGVLAWVTTGLAGVVAKRS